MYGRAAPTGTLALALCVEIFALYVVYELLNQSAKNDGTNIFSYRTIAQSYNDWKPGFEKNDLGIDEWR